MKRCFWYVLICMFLFSFHFVSMADDPLVQADALFEKGDISSILESIPLYVMGPTGNVHAPIESMLTMLLKGSMKDGKTFVKNMGKKEWSMLKKPRNLNLRKSRDTIILD